MDRSKQVGIAAIIFIGIILYIIFDYSKQYISPNILYLTQPISSFSGTISKIEGNMITVNQNYSYSENGFQLPALKQSKDLPLKQIVKTKNISYEVTIANDTRITLPQDTTPYLFPNQSAATGSSLLSKTSIKNLKVGDIVSIFGEFDLRTFKGSRVDAKLIGLASFVNSLTGKVSQVNTSTMKIKSFLLDSKANQIEKEYTITLKPETEISRMNYRFVTVGGQQVSAQTPEKFTIGDLKKDMQVTVFTDSDVSHGNTFTALRVEPAAPAPTGVVTPLAPIAPLATQSAGIK